jgi:hypothetical protein
LFIRLKPACGLHPGNIRQLNVHQN